MARLWKKEEVLDLEKKKNFLHPCVLEVHRDATTRDEILTSWEWFKIAEKERQRECVSERERERERERVCVCVCVRERQRQREKNDFKIFQQNIPTGS